MRTISGSGIEHEFGRRNSPFSLDFNLSPNKGNGSFTVETKENTTGHIAINFESGRVIDGSGNFLDTYNNENNKVRIDVDPVNNVWDYYKNGLPVASQLGSSTVYPDRVKLTSYDTNLQYKFTFSGEEANISFPTELNHSLVDGLITGVLTGNAPGDLTINNVYTSGVSGISVQTYSTDPIVSGGTGQFILYNDYPQSGDYYNIKFDTNYGTYERSMQINSVINDPNYFRVNVLGPDQIFLNNGSGQGIYTIVVDSYYQPTGLQVSLEYVSGNEPVYEQVLGTGVGTGYFSGWVDGSGYLSSSGVTGYYTGTNGYGTQSVLSSGSAISKLVYATGLNTFYYAINGSGVISVDIIESGMDTGTPPPNPITGSGLEFYIQEYNRATTTGSYDLPIDGVITGSTGVTLMSEVSLGKYYFNETLVQIPTSIFISGDEISNSVYMYPITGILQKVVKFSGYHDNYLTTGLSNAYITIQEGIATFLDQWNLKTGEFYTGDMVDYRDNALAIGDKYIDPTIYTNLNSGQTLIYALVDYTSSFNGYHQDVAKLSVTCSGETDFVLITGSNNNINYIF